MASLEWSDERIRLFQTVMEKVKESDMAVAKAAADLAEMQALLEKPTIDFESPRKAVKKTKVLKSSSSNIDVQRRILQFSESIDTLEALKRKDVEAREIFVCRLEKVNSMSWKTQKIKDPLVVKIEEYMMSSEFT